MKIKESRYQQIKFLKNISKFSSASYTQSKEVAFHRRSEIPCKIYDGVLLSFDNKKQKKQKNKKKEDNYSVINTGFTHP